MNNQRVTGPPFFLNDQQLIEDAQAIILFILLSYIPKMNSQQNFNKITVLLLMQEIFKLNNKDSDTIINNTHYLLTFTQVITNSAFVYLDLSDLKASHQKRPKTEGFWVEVFPYLTDEGYYNSFRKHFRITRATFNTIVIKLESHPAFSSNAPNTTPVWKQIAIVLWRLANGVGIRILEQTLGVSQGSVSHFTDRFLKALLDLECNRITWPRGARLATVIQGFEHGRTESGNHKLPNVIGAMDGTHIPIHPPSKNGSRFVNRKNFHSINLLGIVDHQGRFTFIHVGEAGL